MRNLGDFLAHFGGQRREEKEPAPEEKEMARCLSCDADLTTAELYQRFRVCPECRFHYSLSARERVAILADLGTFKETNRTLVSLDPLSFSSRTSYRQRIFEAQRRTGLTDAVITGRCQIDGKPVVLVVLDFGFMGGSMGCVVGEKVALAFERATKRRLPVVTVVASGGARMQEGVLSLMQMAKTAAAVERFHSQGLPYISVMANPTTGGAYASFANLGDIIIAEPGAIVGFAALRIVQQATGRPLPSGAHSAESHLARGMIDQVVDRTRLRDLLSAILDLLNPQYILALKKGRQRQMPQGAGTSPWQAVQQARHQQRPTALDYIQRITTSFVELKGDRFYGDDGAVVCGIGGILDQPAVIIGQERGKGSSGRAYPEGFRKAQRAMRLAAKFRLPLVTLIDTPGAHPSLEAEERGVGNAVAGTMALMSSLPTPTIAAIIGEGGSEGALALGIADRILMLENAIYSVISPENAATLIYRDAGRAEEVAPSLKLTAHDCLELGVIDVIVPEPVGGAHTDPDEAARQLKNHLVTEILKLQKTPVPKLVKERYGKFRRMGEYSSYFAAAISREMAQLQDFMAQRVEDIRERFPRRDKDTS